MANYLKSLLKWRLWKQCVKRKKKSISFLLVDVIDWYNPVAPGPEAIKTMLLQQQPPLSFVLFRCHPFFRLRNMHHLLSVSRLINRPACLTVHLHSVLFIRCFFYRFYGQHRARTKQRNVKQRVYVNKIALIMDQQYKWKAKRAEISFDSWSCQKIPPVDFLDVQFNVGNSPNLQWHSH